MSDRGSRRRAALRKSFKADKIDALLVSVETNVRYLTGFTGDSSALVVTRDRELIVSDGRYEEQLRQECPGLEAHIRPMQQPMAKALGAILAKLGSGRVGFESSGVTVAEFESIRGQAGSVDLVGLSGRVEALRAVKDKDEIDAIRRAVTIAERAFAMLRAGLRPEDSEKKTADALESYLRHCGAVAASFPPIVAAGARAALPHARPEPDARLDAAEFVLIDWGASIGPHPYKSDLTRVLAHGKVGSKFETVYRTVLEAQRRAIAAVRPGAKTENVDAEARSVIEEAGFGRFFGHGLGHGIGLDIHEAPRLRPGAESGEVLWPGMVVTIEPGIYLPGWGGIRIEDDVLVTSDGQEVLSNVPKDLDSVAPW
ncbi:aminopeptidase P family protein [soil metagenome]